MSQKYSIIKYQVFNTEFQDVSKQPIPISDDIDHSLGSQFFFTDLASFQQLSANCRVSPKNNFHNDLKHSSKTYEIQSQASHQLWKQSAELNSWEAGGSWAGSKPHV